MTSTNPPTYYFTGIGFNNTFYSNATSSGLTITKANGLYLRKNYADTATANETFNAGITTNTLSATSSIPSTLDLFTAVTAPVNTFFNLFTGQTSGTIQIGGVGVAHTTSITPTITSRNAGVNNTLWNNCNTNTNYLFNGLTSGSVNIGTGSSFTGNINLGNSTTTGKINLQGKPYLSSPIYAPTTTQSPTSANIGYMLSSILTSSTGLVSAINTYPVFNSNGIVPLPIGSYLMSVTASLCIPANPNTGIIGAITVGFSLGTNVNPVLNGVTVVYSTNNSIDAYGHSCNIPYSFTIPVYITTANSYLTPWASMSITTAFSSTIQLVINNYMIQRIL